MNTARLLGGRWALALPGVLVLGALIRIPFAFVEPRVIADPRVLELWACLLRGGGVPWLLEGTGDMTLYPPLATAALWALGLAGPITPVPPDGGIPTSVSTPLALLKLLAMTADLALAWLVASVVPPDRPGTRAVAAAAIALNPALWYVSAYWGQIDSALLLLVVGAVVAVGRDMPGRGVVALAAAVLWKLLALSVAPAVIAGALRTPRWSRIAAGTGIAVAGALALTWILVPPERLGEYLNRLLPVRATLDPSAFNAWYLVQELTPLPAPWARWLEETGGLLLGGLAAGAIGLWAAIAVLRSNGLQRIALAAAVCALAAFVFLPGMHERYALPVLPLLVLVAAASGEAGDRGAWVAAGVATAATLVNHVAVGSPAPHLWQNVFADASVGPLIPAVSAIGLAVAVVYLAVLGWGIRRLAPASD